MGGVERAELEGWSRESGDERRMELEGGVGRVESEVQSWGGVKSMESKSGVGGRSRNDGVGKVESVGGVEKRAESEGGSRESGVGGE